MISARGNLPRIIGDHILIPALTLVVLCLPLGYAGSRYHARLLTEERAKVEVALSPQAVSLNCPESTPGGNFWVNVAVKVQNNEKETY